MLARYSLTAFLAGAVAVAGGTGCYKTAIRQDEELSPDAAYLYGRFINTGVESAR